MLSLLRTLEKHVLMLYQYHVFSDLCYPFSPLEKCHRGISGSRGRREPGINQKHLKFLSLWHSVRVYDPVTTTKADLYVETLGLST